MQPGIPVITKKFKQFEHLDIISARDSLGYLVDLASSMAVENSNNKPATASENNMPATSGENLRFVGDVDMDSVLTRIEKDYRESIQKAREQMKVLRKESLLANFKKQQKKRLVNALRIRTKRVTLENVPEKMVSSLKP